MRAAFGGRPSADRQKVGQPSASRQLRRLQKLFGSGKNGTAPKSDDVVSAAARPLPQAGDSAEPELVHRLLTEAHKSAIRDVRG
jgi:hypothetical protein